MSLLESVFKYLIKENNKILLDIEAKEGIEKLSLLLADDSLSSELVNTEQAIFQSGEATPDQLLLLANCDLDELIERDRLLPRINFFLETYKIILDTSRQNARLLDLYNKSATQLFIFCAKYKCKKEFRKVSEILHQHYQYIVKSAKTGDLTQGNKIPYPVSLKDEECTTKLLDMRQT
jgi:hypothetical protein